MREAGSWINLACGGGLILVGGQVPRDMASGEIGGIAQE